MASLSILGPTPRQAPAGRALLSEEDFTPEAARRRRLAWALGLDEMTAAERRRALAAWHRENARRRRSDQSLGRLVADLIGTAGTRQGLVIAQLAVNWPSIAGEELARVSRPAALRRSRGKSGAKLVLEVARGFAPLVQHMSAQVIERANGFLGRGSVTELGISQGDLAPLEPPPTKPRPPARKAAPKRPLAALQGFPEGAVHEALESLAATLGVADEQG